MIGTFASDLVVCGLEEIFGANLSIKYGDVSCAASLTSRLELVTSNASEPLSV